MAKGGTAYTAFAEKDFGDYPELGEVLASAKKVAAK